MTPVKRRVSVSLGDELVEELVRDGRAFSCQVKAVVRTEAEQRSSQRVLVQFLDILDMVNGPVDEAMIERYVSLLK